MTTPRGVPDNLPGYGVDETVARAIAASDTATGNALRTGFVPGEGISSGAPWTSALTTRTGGTANDYTCVGVDPISGVAWFRMNGASRIVQCDNPANVVSASAARTLPTGVTFGNVYAIRRLGANVVMLAKETTGNTIGLWWAPAVAQTGDWAWSAQVFTLATGTTGFALGLETSNWGASDIGVVSEYGDPVGGPRIARSTDSGVTWATVYGPDATIRHIHHVMPDPYNPGHVWGTFGDGTAKTIQKSTDYGVTWSVVAASTTWQAVQISFTAKYVFLAADSHNGTAFIVDRATSNVRHLSLNYHHWTPPPYSPSAGRVVTDLVTTSASTAITSATAAFTAADVGKYIEATNQLAPRTWITAVGSSTAATLSTSAFATSGGTTGRISGDMYYANAFFGAVDPSTGIYYCIPNDSSDAGTTQGLFVVARPGGRAEVLDPGGINQSMVSPVFFAAGRVFYGIRSRPTLTKASLSPVAL